MEMPLGTCVGMDIFISIRAHARARALAFRLAWTAPACAHAHGSVRSSRVCNGLQAYARTHVEYIHFALAYAANSTYT
eukprot:635211-Pleurochrysis_carterae.AAC.2